MQNVDVTKKEITKEQVETRLEKIKTFILDSFADGMSEEFDDVDSFISCSVEAFLDNQSGSTTDFVDNEA